MTKPRFFVTIPFLLLIVLVVDPPIIVFATNESSYWYGYIRGYPSLDPQIGPNADWYPLYDNGTCSLHPSYTLANGTVVPSAPTNATACEDGFFKGWKDWCSSNSKHAVGCIQNITMGNMPPMFLQAHHEYIKGYDAANSTGASMCPIGENAVFCNGWNSNNDDYGNGDCADTPLANITTSLMGCISDNIPANQIGGLPVLVGKWHFVNESSTNLELGITGIMLFNNNGYMRTTVPSKTAFGDYTLESSWAYIGTKKHLLTFCYAGGCENSTLTMVMPNHIEFIDNNKDTIHLMRITTSTTQSPPALTAAGTKEMLRNQNNITTIYNNGKLQAGLKNYTGAEALYQHALQIDPHNVKVLSDMGRVLYNMQNYTGALQSLDKALSIDRSSVYALEWKGYILSELGQYKEALVYFNKALSFTTHPFNSIDTLNNKGVTLISLGDYRHAITTFNEALNANRNVRGEIYSFPDASVTYFSKAFALLRLGQHDHDIRDIHLALQTVEKSISFNRDYSDALGLRQSLKDLLAFVGTGPPTPTPTGGQEITPTNAFNSTTTTTTRAGGGAPGAPDHGGWGGGGGGGGGLGGAGGG